MRIPFGTRNFLSQLCSFHFQSNSVRLFLVSAPHGGRDFAATVSPSFGKRSFQRLIQSRPRHSFPREVDFPPLVQGFRHHPHLGRAHGVIRRVQGGVAFVRVRVEAPHGVHVRQDRLLHRFLTGLESLVADLLDHGAFDLGLEFFTVVLLPLLRFGPALLFRDDFDVIEQPLSVFVRRDPRGVFFDRNGDLSADLRGFRDLFRGGGRGGGHLFRQARLHQRPGVDVDV